MTLRIRVRILVTAITFSCAAILFTAVYNLQRHQMLVPPSIWCVRLNIPWVGKSVGPGFLSFSSHLSCHHYDITEILLIWRKTSTNKQKPIHTHSFTFTHSHTRLHIHSLIHPYSFSTTTHSLIDIHTLITTLAYSFTHSFTHSLTHSPTNSLTY